MHYELKKVALIIWSVLLFTIIIFFYGAIPFYSLPTMLQALWTTGYAQSIANSPFLLDVYAHNIGYPTPAAIAFGLSGALPTSYFIRMGLNAANAYSLMVMLWIFIAYYYSYKICIYYNTNKFIAWFLALLWLSMPTVWAHAGYSMLSLGIALLPFYFYATTTLFIQKRRTFLQHINVFVFYLLACIISVFMDGYSFVMFACLSSATALHSLISINKINKLEKIFKIALHFISFSIAFFLYTRFVGGSTFSPSPLDFFRGWGLDISFIFRPSSGFSWIADNLGFSVERSDVLYFGDDSVWQTTFCIPIIITSITSWFYLNKKNKFSTTLLILSIFSFYLALGPSLKVNAIKSTQLQLEAPQQQSAQMPKEYGITETGTAWISSKIPGFNSMRAAYRWSALGIFSCWLLFVIFSGTSKHKKSVWFVSTIIIALNLPNIRTVLAEKVEYRENFEKLQSQLVPSLGKHVLPGEKVMFLPQNNDFVITFAAPLLKIKAFNIGGDKNIMSSQKKWPDGLFHYNDSDNLLKENIITSLLLDKTTDSIVLPYFNTLTAGVYWPCKNDKTIDEQGETHRIYNSIPGVKCPTDYKSELTPLTSLLKENPILNVQEENLFSIINLKKQYIEEASRVRILNEIYKKIEYPITISDKNPKNIFILKSGWNNLESHLAWSKDESSLFLPVPENCISSRCHVILNFGVLAPSAQREVIVHVSSMNSTTHWKTSLTIREDGLYTIKIPLYVNRGTSIGQFKININNATSPAALNMAPDFRVLGISLFRIDLEK